MKQMLPWNASSNADERTAILNEKLVSARTAVPRGSEWQHKKGGFYKVTGYAIDTDTGDVRIRYARYAGPGYNAAKEWGIEFVRPVAEWTVDRFVQVS